jgi:hypothetical protein
MSVAPILLRLVANRAPSKSGRHRRTCDYTAARGLSGLERRYRMGLPAVSLRRGPPCGAVWIQLLLDVIVPNKNCLKTSLQYGLQRNIKITSDSYP